MRIEETRLPGIGARYDFATEKGRRVGVISQRDGARHVFLYDPRDPDACQATIVLSAEESQTLAELLGAPRIVERAARPGDDEGVLPGEISGAGRG
jgi:TrkA domain protein